MFGSAVTTVYVTEPSLFPKIKFHWIWNDTQFVQINSNAPRQIVSKHTVQSPRHLFLPHQWADWAYCIYFVDISLIVFVSSTLLSNSLNLNSVMCTGFCQIWVTLCWLHVTVQKALSTNCHIHRSKSSFKGKAELVTHRCRDGVLTKGESIQVHYLNKSIHTPL